MKVFLSGVLCIGTVMLAGCQGPETPSASNFEQGMKQYLAEHGRLCLAKRSWPIDVTPREFVGHARNAIQLPVMERLGLVSSSDAVVTYTDEDLSETVNVKRYALTDLGKQYYVASGTGAAEPGAVPASDLCVGTLSLDKVVRWDPPQQAGEHKQTTVTYTYRIDAAPWMKDPLARSAFPVVADVIDGAGKRELKQEFSLSPQGWKAATAG